MVDESTKKTLSNIPLLQTKAGPRDKDLWVQRLKEEYQALIKVRELMQISFACKLVSVTSIWNNFLLFINIRNKFR